MFPFGVPCWLKDQLAQFDATPVAPHFSITAPALFGSKRMSVNAGSAFGVGTDTVMAIVRPLLLALTLIAIVLWLASKTGGFGGGGGSTAGSGEE